RILYTGSFYDRRQPDNLWQAVSELVRDGQLDPQQVEIKIIGRNTIDFVLGSFVSDEMIRSMVLIKGFITHGETLIEMQTADVLLIYIPSGPNSASVLTGKLFEYLRTGKAILTIAPPKGLAAKIVTEAGTGFVADFDDISSIKEQVHKLYISWKQGSLKLIKSDQSYISRFSRQEQARQLADLIREIL
ncbi:MAG TPA: hypothetical protein P5533_08260, partial [Candidatus Cloacimonadota bacterium]|nr:hypothetical protein [Candidatus Cloacimonadota bacterium]